MNSRSRYSLRMERWRSWNWDSFVCLMTVLLAFLFFWNELKLTTSLSSVK